MLRGNKKPHTHTHKHAAPVPFHLGAPQYVLLVVHVDGEMLVFPLLHRVGACRYRTQLLKLELASRTKHAQTDTNKQTNTRIPFNPTAYSHFQQQLSVIQTHKYTLSHTNTHTYTQVDTLAVRPCSRHSCRSSLSFAIGVSGLQYLEKHNLKKSCIFNSVRKTRNHPAADFPRCPAAVCSLIAFIFLCFQTQY